MKERFSPLVEMQIKTRAIEFWCKLQNFSNTCIQKWRNIFRLCWIYIRHSLFGHSL